MNEELIKIRKVNQEDAKEWYDLWNRVWRDAYNHIFPEEVFVDRESHLDEKIKKFSEKMKNDNENISCVAEYDGKIVGLMYGCIHSLYEHFKEEYADLVALYINPKYQGLGIGSKLKEAFEEWAIENGATKYVIGVLKDNIKARMAYESWGGKLSDYETGFVRLEIEYPEVFYTYDLQKKLDKNIKK